MLKGEPISKEKVAVASGLYFIALSPACYRVYGRQDYIFIKMFSQCLANVDDNNP